MAAVKSALGWPAAQPTRDSVQAGLAGPGLAEEAPAGEARTWAEEAERQAGHWMAAEGPQAPASSAQAREAPHQAQVVAHARTRTRTGKQKRRQRSNTA